MDQTREKGFAGIVPIARRLLFGAPYALKFHNCSVSVVYCGRGVLVFCFRSDSHSTTLTNNIRSRASTRMVSVEKKPSIVIVKKAVTIAVAGTMVVRISFRCFLNVELGFAFIVE